MDTGSNKNTDRRFNKFDEFDEFDKMDEDMRKIFSARYDIPPQLRENIHAALLAKSREMEREIEREMEQAAQVAQTRQNPQNDLGILAYVIIIFSLIGSAAVLYGIWAFSGIFATVIFGILYGFTTVFVTVSGLATAFLLDNLDKMDKAKNEKMQTI
ncbi:MAG: hypothetical protein FWG68_00600 [Defluviitaleaceae bacterium]|nr:hypothetical protein [Defluviitaleaceae bacterium]